MSEMMQAPDGWEIGNIGLLVKNLDSKRIPLKEGDRQEISGHYPYYGASGIIDWVDDFIFDGEYILLGEDGENVVSRVLPLAFKATGKIWVNNHAHVFECKKNVNIDYVVNLLESTDYKIIINGSAQPKITQDGLNKLFFKIAPPKEQEKIAKILSTLDKEIESTNRLIEKEKNIKTALMQELLTNGIDQNGQIRSPQTHTYKPSELGLIPDEWEVVSLDKIGNVITGNTPPTDNEDYYNGNIQFIGPVDFVGQKYIAKTEKTVSKDGLNYSREIPKDSILTVCIGSTIGKIALAVKQCCTNQQINALICDKKYFSEFIFYAMSQFLQRQLDVEAGLQAVPIVNKSSFAKLVLPCPLDIEEQKQIAKILSTQDKKIQTEETNLAKLKELKKGLMNDLLSGTVRVKV